MIHTYDMANGELLMKTMGDDPKKKPRRSEKPAALQCPALGLQTLVCESSQAGTMPDDLATIDVERFLNRQK